MRSVKYIAVVVILAFTTGLLASCAGGGQSPSAQSVSGTASSDVGATATTQSTSGTAGSDVGATTTTQSTSGTTGSDAGATASAPSDDAERYSAYYAKCQEYSTIYGAPSEVEYGSQTKVASGLDLVRLVDFDEDGADELLIGYMAPDSMQALEVWSYRNGTMTRDYEGKLSAHTTNGPFWYVEVVRRADANGYAINAKNCLGSGPATYIDELCGYASGGAFDVLAKRGKQMRENTVYYICPNEYGLAWTPEKWREVSEGEYEDAFATIAGERLLHLHMFEEESGNIPCDSGSHLADTLEGTREAIGYLAQHAG